MAVNADVVVSKFAAISLCCFVLAPCPYEPVPNEVGQFRSIDNPSEIQTCAQGMAFQDPPCDCVQVGKSRCTFELNPDSNTLCNG